MTWSPTFNVTAYGAVGGGTVTTANGPAFQAAIDAARSAGGGVVLVPLDRYYFDPGFGGLRLWAGVSLMGQVPGPFEVYGVNPITTTIAPTLLITSTTSSYANGGVGTAAFLTCQGFEGYVSDLLFAYPNQQVPVSDLTVPFNPTVYPWTIATDLGYTAPLASSPFAPGGYIQRCTVFGASHGVLVGAGRWWIEKVHVGAYVKGVQSDYAADGIHWVDVEVSPLWNDVYIGPGGYGLSNADRYIAAHQVAYTVGRSDGFQIQNCSAYGSFVAYDFYRNGDVGPFGELLNPYAENIVYAIRLRGATNPNGVQMFGGAFVLAGQVLQLTVAGSSVVAGDSVSVTFTPPSGTPATVSYTVTASDAAQPTLAARWTAVATGLRSAVAAAALTYLTGLTGVTTGSQGAFFQVSSAQTAVLFLSQVQPSTIGVAVSSTGGHTTLATDAANLVVGTWFLATSAANGSEFLTDGNGYVLGYANTAAPQVSANGLYVLRIAGYNVGPSGSGLGPVQPPIAFPSTQPTGGATYYNVTYDAVMLNWSAAASVSVYSGGGWGTGVPNPSLQIGAGTSGSVRVPVAGGVTFAYTNGSPPTLYPYAAG